MIKKKEKIWSGEPEVKWIGPSEAEGNIQAPPSKSMMIRAVAAGFLGDGETHIINPSLCEDAIASLYIVEALGAEVKTMKKKIKLTGERRPAGTTHLDCGESGLCMRMFTPVAALFKDPITLDGKGSLRTRPMGMVESPLRDLGCSCQTNRGRPPVKVTGPLRGGYVRFSGSLSSQFLTGLLMALPLGQKDSELSVGALQSKPYIAMTLSLLSDFGIDVDHNQAFSQFHIKGSQRYLSRDYSVERDWSGAAFFLVAGAIGGRVGILDLSLNTQQADKKILEALELVGARIHTQNNLVTVEKNRLRAFHFDASHCPDLFPPLVVLACSCEGRSVIHGVERLFFKESNRADSLMKDFRKIGARIEIENGAMIIEGRSLEGGVIDSHDDHRIAMAAAVAGLVSSKGVIIERWKCVSKSYPGFFEDLALISRETG